MEPKSKKFSSSHLDKDGNFSLLQTYIDKVESVDLCQFIGECLAIDLNFNKEWMVQLDENYKDSSDFSGDSLIGQTNILVGPALSGKMGLVYWKKQQILDVHLIKIDCCYHSSVHSFISNLVEKLAIVLDKCGNKRNKSSKNKSIDDVEELSKRIVMETNLNLSALDNHIRAKPNARFLFVLQNAEVLVQAKKQTILYNFFQWIKGDIKQHIGLILITRNLSFVDRLEKRVKSRMTAKITSVFGAKNEKIVKQALIKRFQFGFKQLNDDADRRAVKKIIECFEKSIVIQNMLKAQMQRSRKPITFFLQVFKLVFTMKIDDTILLKHINSKNSKQFQEFIKQRYEQAKQHIRPYAQEQQLIFRQMNMCQFIIMAVIRKMMKDGKPKISFKEIKKQIITHKTMHYNKFGGSFDFSDNAFERSIKGLNKLKVLEIYNKHDFENADLISHMEPDDIKEAIEGREDIPEYIKDLL